MSNKFKGEYQLSNGMRMVMDYNCLADVEEITGVPALDIIGSIDEGNAKITHIRAFYWAALKRFQPNISLEAAGDVFSENPGALGAVIAAASPAPAEQPAGKGQRAVKK